MHLPTTSSIINPSPTVVVIASVLLLFGIVSFLPDSDEIYSVYSLDDDNDNDKNINNNRKRNNNNINNYSNNSNSNSNNNNSNCSNNSNNNVNNLESNNNHNIYNSNNNKETFFNRFKRMFSFLSKSNQNSQLEVIYDSEDYSTSSSISSSTSSLYLNSNNNNNNNNNINNNNSNNNNNSSYQLLLQQQQLQHQQKSQELIDQINAERTGRLIAEKKIEEKEMLLHSLQNEMAQREEFEKKLLQLCTLEIKKKKQFQTSLNELSEQISFILDTISNQTLVVNASGANNSGSSDGDNNSTQDYFIDENECKLNNINDNSNNNNNNNSNNNSNNSNNKIMVSIDSNLLEQFENISNLIKSHQHNNSNSDSEHDNQNQQSHYINNSNNLPKEEALYLELVKMSKQKIPFNFSDIISN